MFRKETHKRVSAVAAIEYSQNQTPRVVRKGIEEAGNDILRDARRYGVPIVTDRKLSEGLASTFSNEDIPEEMFGSVARHLIRLKLHL